MARPDYADASKSGVSSHIECSNAPDDSTWIEGIEGSAGPSGLKRDKYRFTCRGLPFPQVIPGMPVSPGRWSPTRYIAAHCTRSNGRRGRDGTQTHSKRRVAASPRASNKPDYSIRKYPLPGTALLRRCALARYPGRRIIARERAQR